MGMEIRYVRQYTEHGCNIRGSLAVIDYSDRAEEIRAEKPLSGFNSGSFIDALEEAKSLMLSRHSDCKIKLGIPDLVVEIPDDEWQEWNMVEYKDVRY